MTLFLGKCMLTLEIVSIPVIMVIDSIDGIEKLSALGVVCALLLFTWMKTIPLIVQNHKEGLEAIAGEVKGLRSDAVKHQDDQLNVLKEAMKPK